jgi:hypothetical protein
MPFLLHKLFGVKMKCEDNDEWSGRNGEGSDRYILQGTILEFPYRQLDDESPQCDQMTDRKDSNAGPLKLLKEERQHGSGKCDTVVVYFKVRTWVGNAKH